MACSERLHRLSLALLAVGMYWLHSANSAKAVERVYTLVQNSSTIAISGTVDGVTITSQGTNNFGQSSLVARYAGTIRTDRVSNSINSIAFLPGSSIDAIVNGSWRPGVGGTSAGPAPADYGGDLTVSGADIDMAGRGLVADLVTSGAALNIANGQFSLATTDVDLTAGNVDYRGLLFGFIVVLDGTYGLAGQGGDLSGTASLSTQSLGSGMLRESLTIPVDSTLPPVVVSGYSINLRLTGSLLATSDFADDGNRYWVNASGGTFGTSSNWNPTLVPGTTDTAIFGLSSTYAVAFSSAATNSRVRIENTNLVTFNLGTNTYSLSNTSTSTPSVIVGDTPGATSRLILSGTGTGGTLSSVHSFLGSAVTSNGQVSVGAGATWNSTGQLSIGRNGSGTLTLSGGGDFLSPSSGITYLGYESGSSGSVTVNGAGSTMTNGQLYVGRQGTGVMTLSSGGLVTSTTARIGSQATGTVNVSGSSTFTSSNTLYVGEQAQGSLSIQSGSTLNSVTTNLGSSASSNGTVTITGTGSNWNNTGSIYVGGTSSAAGNQGTIHINSNASVTVGSVLRTWSGGTVNLTSGKLKTSTLHISQGTFNQTGGQLVATTVTGNLNRTGGSLTPGDTSQAGQTNISGNYIQQAGTSLTIELGGLSPVSQFDRLFVGGTATLAGTLNVSLINNFAPTVGNSFQIVSASGGRSGTFATENLPALSNADWEWLVNYGSNSLILSVGLKGDYNGDGFVNAADYAVWRDADGTQSKYTLWRSQFGDSANGSGSSNSQAPVPEPAASTLFVLASTLFLKLKLRRRASWFRRVQEATGI